MKRVLMRDLDRAEAFRQSEASVRLEGIDPSLDPRYLELKARVLSGEITSNEAVTELIASSSISQSNAA
jgi:hypothetical protein